MATLIVSILGSASSPAAEQPVYRGRLLAEVLQELRGRGIDLLFSTAVVRDDLRVTVEPSATEPRAVLEQILEPLGLQAQAGPSGSILILPRMRDVGNLKGQVLSAGRGIPIGGASVLVADTSDRTSSSTDGSFELRGVPVGTHQVVVEAFGFKTTTVGGVRVTRSIDAEITVELDVQLAVVTEVVVTPSRFSVVQQEQDSRLIVDTDDVVLVPTIGGDISRVVELLPGVAAPDNSAGFHVRGSEKDDVSVILDGLELYDPFHLRSFQSPFSVIDSKIVDRIDFFGGGFTADLGDRHGGFVEISTLVPESPSLGEVELGTLNSRVSYRAPMSDATGSWLLSARAWYPEALRDSVGLAGGERLDPRFGDAYAKVSFNVSPRTLISAHGLLAYDRATFDEADEDVNENASGLTRSGDVWIRALNSWSPDLVSETVLSGGRIQHLRSGLSAPDDEGILVEDDRVVNFLGLKHDATLQISSSHAFRSGVDIRWLDGAYRYSNRPEDDPRPPAALRLHPEGTSIGAYAAHRARISAKLATEVGVRWDLQAYTDDNQVSPRFNAVWRASEQSEIRLSLGRFNQSQRINQLQVEDGETEFLPAEVSEQADMMFQHRFQGGLRLRVDGYYRRLSRLRPRYENLFEPVELFPETALDRVRISPSRARLRGVELLLRNDAGRPLTWWASYALSSAEDVVDGEFVPRSWDQPHAVKCLVGYRWNERWSLSLAGTAHTGWPTTPQSGVLITKPDGTTRIEPVLGARNSDRFDNYLRLDAKARHAFALPRGRLALTVEIVNLTDRDNACCVDEFAFEARPDGTVDVQREFEYWLGFTPSFSVLWEF